MVVLVFIYVDIYNIICVYFLVTALEKKMIIDCKLMYVCYSSGGVCKRHSIHLRVWVRLVALGLDGTT